MDRLLKTPRTALPLVALLLAVLLALQAAAAAVAPAMPVSSTGESVGRAGFAYLGGLRVFAAAVLWNHLDPQYDNYYAGTHVKDLVYVLPTIYLVQRLDPQFVQAYYNAAYILADRGKWSEAYAVADDGLTNNPNNGLMYANVVELLLKQDKKANLDKALKFATRGLGPGIVYQNGDDEFESLGVFRTAFSLAGRGDVVAAILKRQDELRAAGYSNTGLAHSSDASSTTGK